MVGKYEHKITSQLGFSLIELIVVIIIISVLAVSAFSRFSGTDGFSEYTYQSRLITALRNMQTRAMQDNRAGYCFKINIDTSSTPAFGPPILVYVTSNETDKTNTCAASIDFNNPDYLATTASEMSEEGVNISTTPTFTSIDFDGLGRPVDSSGNLTCTTGCTISLTGESTVSVCIESQGYIHACN